MRLLEHLCLALAGTEILLRHLKLGLRIHIATEDGSLRTAEGRSSFGCCLCLSRLQKITTRETMVVCSGPVDGDKTANSSTRGGIIWNSIKFALSHLISKIS
jgi:hypothetical protein